MTETVNTGKGSGKITEEMNIAVKKNKNSVSGASGDSSSRRTQKRNLGNNPYKCG